MTLLEYGTECSETSVYKIQRPGNHPKEIIQTFRTRRKFEIKNFINCSTFTKAQNDGYMLTTKDLDVTFIKTSTDKSLSVFAEV